jgi:putative nucleotidyltransferase with HDIG domain
LFHPFARYRKTLCANGGSDMRKVLFVDDDARVLQALKILLRHNLERWDMAFAVGGQAALDKLKEEYFDVIVSDMRMPGIDGAALLRRVQEEYPHMLRIVLSAYTDLESVLRVVPVAHQFMTKPCEVAVLEDAIERACSMSALVSDAAMRRRVGKIDRLPSLPRVYSALIRTLSQPDVPAADVVRILKQDIAICAKLLQLANSSFFQLAQRITSVERAVVYLGFNMIKNLVLSVELFQAAKSIPEGFSVDLLQRHSLATANLASRLLGPKEKREDAFMAGLLHDIGKLVFAQEYPEHLDRIRAAMRTDERPEFIVEQELAGVSHAEVGAYLLGLWGLPDAIVQAVAHHHMPHRMEESNFDVLSATYVANHLVNEHTRLSPNGTRNRQEIDRSYLAARGALNKLGMWREIASEQAQQATD